jgi:hypothetical protein
VRVAKVTFLCRFSPGSYLKPKTGFCAVSPCFFSVLRANTGIVPWNRLRALSSQFIIRSEQSFYTI